VLRYASLGAFIYNNDTHEIDFEVGYGKQTLREQLNAEADDLIVYMTSQGNFQSFNTKKKKRTMAHFINTTDIKLKSKVPS
jgi:hypothetical protein